MQKERENFYIREHCHVNTNIEGDRFVGVKADANRIAVYFPIGYELSNSNEELRSDIKNLLRVLATFTQKTDRVLERGKTDSHQSVEFPIQAYLNIINYYLDNNGSYYTESETTYKLNNLGNTNWSKTIKTQKPLIQEDSVIYLKQVVRESTSDLNQLITGINRYCVYESFERIGWLYTTNRPENPNIKFDKNRFLATLNSKLVNTNNDNDKLLFRSMIAMIEFVDNRTSEKQFYFGTDKFEIVWEKLIEKYFGEKNKSDYFPRGLWIEKKYGSKIGRKVSALEPDSIMIFQNKFYVLDAKYYRYGVFPEYGIGSLPQSSDINKQITYGKFVKNERANGNPTFNAFIMPFNKNDNKFSISDNYGNVAEATGDWLDDPKNPQFYERIQTIVIDTRYLLTHYDGSHDFDKNLLSYEIENGLKL